MRILVLGYGFVDRLSQDIRNQRHLALGPDLNLKESGVIVRFCGLVGGTIDTLLSDSDGTVDGELVNYPPWSVVLQIGGNDLDSVSFDKQVYMAKVRQFIFKLHSVYNVQTVVLCETFGLKPTYADLEVYHNLKNEINLAFYLEFYRKDGIHFWFHKGGLMSNEELFDSDEVHLNLNGTIKFYRSLRGAVIKTIHC